MVQASGVSLDDGACCINGCSRDVHARGMCRMHYDRWRRGGMGARKKRMSVHASSAEGFSRLSAGIRRRVPTGVGRRGTGNAAGLRFVWIPSRIR